ncbi:lipoyl synthase [Achromatium sp. WMS3]|nr:lipoyl synthase [Achromatium sp. WMS3]
MLRVPAPKTHQRGSTKLEHITTNPTQPRLRLPPWIRTRIPCGSQVTNMKRTLRLQGLTSVCEEAACPNLGECFNKNTATFMIMGDRCTRRCSFCDVAHGKPIALDRQEPIRLAQAVQILKLRYLVITSVTRDDLQDGGSAHYADCIRQIRSQNAEVKIEILVPDFRGCRKQALQNLFREPPDIFNHNLETIPRLYTKVRPGANYVESLKLLQEFATLCPKIPTKSGLMLGLGETAAEVKVVLQDLLANGCQALTLGQYLQPSSSHLPVARFIPPDEFASWQDYAYTLGFVQVASAPLVRSSYHAESQARPFF